MRVCDRLSIASSRSRNDVVWRWSEIRNGAERAWALQSTAREPAPCSLQRQTGGQGLPFRSTIAPDEEGEVVVSVLGSLGEFADVIDSSPADGRLVVTAMERALAGKKH